MQKDDNVYLHHILDAILRIESYLSGVSKEQFLENGLLQDGVVRQLEVIGEASRNLSDEFQESHPEVPWGEIVGLRNRIVHAYFKIDFKVAWDIARDDLPSLKKQVSRFLEE